MKKNYKLFLLSIVFLCTVIVVAQNTTIKRTTPKTTHKSEVKSKDSTPKQKPKTSTSKSKSNNELSTKVNESVTLSYGDYYYGDFNYHASKDEDAMEEGNVLYRRFMNSDLLDSNKLNALFKDIKSAIDRNTSEFYDSEFFDPFIGGVDPYYKEDLNIFLHQNVKNKLVRQWGMKIFSDYAIKLCTIYPKDLKIKLEKELSRMINYIDVMSTHSYTIDECNKLYIDGVEAPDEMTMSCEGFVVRRILVDKIPKSELKSLLQSMRGKITNVNNSKQPDYLAKCTINNKISYYIGRSEKFYVIHSSGKKISMENYSHRLSINKDSNGDEYFLIEYGWKSSYRGEWNTYKNSPSPIYIDKNGNIMNRKVSQSL